MWEFKFESLKSNHIKKVSIFANTERLSYAEVIDLWQQDEEFGSFFTQVLASSNFPAYFWETPPITLTNVNRVFEFVLVDSPNLARVVPNSNPFREHFVSLSSPKEIITFPNLRQDALLVVPCPRADISVYPHIASFMRKAPQTQQNELWKTLGRVLKQRLNEQPTWVSTSGLGVYWLHIRLDSYPKYYNFQPYKFWTERY